MCVCVKGASGEQCAERGLERKREREMLVMDRGVCSREMDVCEGGRRICERTETESEREWDGGQSQRASARVDPSTFSS